MPKQKVFLSKVLSSHPFMKLLMSNLRSTFEVLGAHYMHLANTGELTKRWSKPKYALTTRKRKSNQSNFSDEENYHLGVFDYASNIISASERLEEMRIYLNRFPQSRIFEKHNVTENKWIHYHYSNYLITVVGIFDTALLLTNAVFMLGLEPRQCSKETVLENYWVRRTQVKSALQGLDKIVDPYRPHRNFYVHRSETPRLEILDILVTISINRNAVISIMDNKTLRFLYRLARKEITQALDEEFNRIEVSLTGFFDALQLIYSKGINKVKLDAA